MLPFINDLNHMAGNMVYLASRRWRGAISQQEQAGNRVYLARRRWRGGNFPRRTIWQYGLPS